MNSKETIEEAAERLYPISKGGLMWMASANDCMQANKQEGFIGGAKSDAARDYWYAKFQKEQDKKMYSEEEVEVIARDAYKMGRNNIYLGVFRKWFEQLKKK